jgi:NAD(P)-dependent dehydrogenase (short-subunit alcohol dehydrogenase family)
MKGVEVRGASVAITGASAGIGWACALAFARGEVRSRRGRGASTG